NAWTGRYRLVEMPARIGAAGAPAIRVVDMTRHPSRSGLSTPLLDAIDRHLADGRQVLLFLNRRGFAPTLFCPSCQKVEECRRCAAPDMGVPRMRHGAGGRRRRHATRRRAAEGALPA